MADIKDRIVATIYDVTKPARPDLSDHSKPLLAGTLDSLDFATFLMALEDEFGVDLSTVSPEAVGSIEHIARFLETREA
jgi:acyl carrier protein